MHQVENNVFWNDFRINWCSIMAIILYNYLNSGNHNLVWSKNWGWTFSSCLPSFNSDSISWEQSLDLVK